MARKNGTTTQRGYGSQHQALRARLLAAWKPGQPCARCGQPMLYRWLIDASGRRVSAIDLGHNDGKNGYQGLEHRACNRRDGQAKTTAINRARGITPAQATAIRMRQWARAQASAMADGAPANRRQPSRQRSPRVTGSAGGPGW